MQNTNFDVFEKGRMSFRMFPNTAKESEVARLAMEACEEIANEMGAEVHDDLIQKLTVFSLNIDRLERAIHHPAEAESLILKMRVDFHEVAHTLRRISHRLMPDNIDGESFTKAIDMLCRNMELPSQGLTHFMISGKELELPALTKRYLYRIVQELVHNAFKNSAAWHVWIKMNWMEDCLLLEVEDDGTAFANIQEKINRLKHKNNTLTMRSQAIGAKLVYCKGKNGLLARVTVPVAR